MHKLLKVYLLLLILSLSAFSVFADAEFFVPCGGDGEASFLCVGDGENSFIGNTPSSNVVSVDSFSGGGVDGFAGGNVSVEPIVKEKVGVSWWWLLLLALLLFWFASKDWD